MAQEPSATPIEGSRGAVQEGDATNQPDDKHPVDNPDQQHNKKASEETGWPGKLLLDRLRSVDGEDSIISDIRKRLTEKRGGTTNDPSGDLDDHVVY